MTKIYFTSYSEQIDIPIVGRVATINEPGYENLYRLDRAGLENTELNLKYMAAVTGSGFYYQKLLEVQNELHEIKVAKAEITEKYPYDGYSTFEALLQKALR
ncbi:MAG: hypothetical protein IJ727_01860 [Treponema sp.]|nr:hypothetical protein [Treponema sp.]